MLVDFQALSLVCGHAVALRTVRHVFFSAAGWLLDPYEGQA